MASSMMPAYAAGITVNTPPGSWRGPSLSAHFSTESKQEVERTLLQPTDESIVQQDHNIRFEDAGAVVSTDNRGTLEKLYSSVNPYKNDAPLDVLKRPVLIHSLSWGAATTSLLNTFPLYDIVTTSAPHQYILGKLNGVYNDAGMYRYLRCNIKITVKINSTQYHQGALVAFWPPPRMGNAYFQIQHCMAFNSIIMSAASQDQCVMHIPFFSPLPHWDLLKTVPAEYHALFGLTVLNKLLTSSPTVVNSVPVEVFAQLEDINLYGVLPQPSPTPPMRRPRVGVTYESQSGKFKPRDGEADAKDAVGMAAHGLMQLAKPIIKSVPFVPEVINLGKFLFNNLDKPTSQQATTMTLERPHRAHTLLKGQDFSEPLSQEPSFNVSDEIGWLSSNMAVTQYAQKPTLYYTTTATTPGVVVSIAAHPLKYASSVRVEPDFLAFATSFYGYWRGSIKYLLHFVGTPFYSARFKISVAHTGAPPANTTESGGTGFYSRVVDVKGDAWTTVTVPYLNPAIWSRSADLTNCSYLVLELMSPIQGSNLPAQAIYYVNIFRAAASDFQLAQLTRSQNLTVPDALNAHRSVSVYESQCSLDEKFGEVTEGITTINDGYIESGLFMADVAGTISDACKRFVQHDPLTVGGFSFPEVPVSSPNIFSPFVFWNLGFYCWRGSRRVKVGKNMRVAALQDPSHQSTTIGHANEISYDNNTTGMHYYTVPWYYEELYYPGTGITNTNNTIWPADAKPLETLTDETIWIAAGDDFNYFYPRPPLVSNFLLYHDTKAKAKKEAEVTGIKITPVPPEKFTSI